MGIPLVAGTIHTEAPSPLEEYGKMMQIRQMGQQSQLSQAQLTGVNQENQQRGLQLQDQQTLRALSPQFVQKDASGNIQGYDFNGLMQAAQGKGVSPITLNQLQLQHADTVSKLASADEAQRTNELSKNKQLYDMMEGVKAITDPVQRQNAYQQSLMQAQKLGVNVQKLPPQVPDNAAITAFEVPLGVHAQQLADADKLSTIAKNSAEAKGAGLKEYNGVLYDITGSTPTPAIKSIMQPQDWANIINRVAAPGTPLNASTAAQVDFFLKQGNQKGAQDVITKAATESQSPETQKMNDWLSKNPGKGPSDYEVAMKKIVPAFNFNLQQGGVSGGAPLSPAQQATATAILEGRQSPPGSFALKTPYWQNIMGRVFLQDPQWSEQRAQLRKSYTQDKEIGAINTSLGHVGALIDSIDGLNNGDIKLLNSVGNRLGIEFGTNAGNAAAMFKTIVHRVGPEISKAYIGAGGAAGERGTTESDFSENLAPSILRGNAAITAQLLRSKIASKAFQWDKTKSDSMPSFEDRFIMPAAKQALDKLAPQGGGGANVIYARDPNGVLHQAAAGTPLPAGWKVENKKQ